MRILGTDIYAQRNETFGIDFTVRNADGTPYIVSSELDNPYLLLSIASTNYKQDNRYIKNYWLDMSNYPRFENTLPFDLTSLMTTSGGSTPRYTSFAAATYLSTLTVGGVTYTDVVAYGYVGTEFKVFHTGDAVFYCPNSQGVIEYKYSHESDGVHIWSDYSFRIIKQFLQQDMSELVEQSYVYSIHVVSGQPSEDKPDWPIGQFNTFRPIISKSKFVIQSAINGGM